MATTRRIVTTVVIVAGLLALTSVSTLAVFTDQRIVAANTVSTGMIDLGASPTSALVTYSGMVAGDAVTDDVVVTNRAGSSALRYSVSSTATNTDAKGLKDQLVLQIKTIDVTTPVSPCSEFDGTQLYSGDLDATAGLLVGNPAQGFHTGDRPLAVAGEETLCFRVTLPVGTATSFDLSTTTATFTFTAEQTANNL